MPASGSTELFRIKRRLGFFMTHSPVHGADILCEFE
jgi:hypothetical protein